jgi:hypothetical protein
MSSATAEKIITVDITPSFQTAESVLETLKAQAVVGC